MANIDAPSGLVPVRYLSGAPWLGAVNPYKIASGYGTTLLPGDPVKAVADGSIERAGEGDTILGAFWGVSFSQDASRGFMPDQQPYWPASQSASDAVALVVDDPNVIFELQADGTLAATDVFANADLSAAAGSTVTRKSGYELKVSTLTASSAQVRILRLVDRPNNEWGANAKVEVLIVEHFYKATAGVLT